MEKIEMHIEGMHCGGCATGIQMVSMGLPGMKSAFVDLDGKKGTFEFDPTKVTREKLIAAIAELGYTAS